MNKEPNPHEHLPGGVTVIFLQHKGQTLRCLIDTADFEKVSRYRWYAERNRNTFYARTKTPGRNSGLRMHVLLLPDAEQADHKNRDGLDNQRRNLRPATSAQNMANRRSGHKNRQGLAYKGVYLCKRNGKLRAEISMNGSLIYLGSFATEVAAARAYNAAALKHFGEFAALNWLEPLPTEREPGAFIPKDNCAGD